MKKTVIILLLSFIYLSGINIMAQERLVKGNVFDAATNEPVHDVKVQVKDTELSSFTNEQGFFEIQVPANLKTISFSNFNGMNVKRIEIIDENTYHIFLDREVDIFDLSLEELMNMEVIVASKKEEKTSDAPGIITVISRKEIEGYAAKNLGEILNRVVGTSFLSPDVFLYQSVSFRGQDITPYNNHVLILLNGRPVRDPITGGMNATMYTAYPPEFVDKIEIIRGPGSVLYGSCAYSGVINIITQKNISNGMKGSAGVDGGSYKYLGQNANIMYKKDDFIANVSVRHSDMEGPEYNFKDYNLLDSSDYFYNETFAVNANISYKGFSFDGLFAQALPYSLNGGEYWDSEYRNQHITAFGNLGYNKAITDNFEASINLTFNQHTWLDKAGVDNTIGNSWLPEITFNYNPITDLNVVFGGGFENTKWEGERLIDGEQNSGFFYTQADYTVSKFKFIGGVQVNKIENIKVNYSPRIGVIANFTENLGAKFLYSQAFRKGYPNETSFGVVVFRGNPDLEPELIDTYEAQLFYNTTEMQYALTYYNSNITNLITRKRFIDDSPRGWYLQYLNEGTWRFWGFEFESKFLINDNLMATLSANYQENLKEDTLVNASLHPNYMIKAGLIYSKNRILFGLYNSFFGEPHSTTVVNQNSRLVNEEPTSYNLLSAKIRVKAFTMNSFNMFVFAEGDNLLNKFITYPDYPNKSLNSFMPLYDGMVLRAGITIQF